MENLILFLATSLVFRLPSSKKLKNHFIGNTGCSALVLPHARGFMHTTGDGDRLYLQEFEEGKMSFGIICIHLQDGYTLDEAGTILSNYLDKLRDSFGIRHFVGAQTTEDWNSVCSHSLVDYWQDGQQCDWKVKAYTNGQVLSVLYVKNIAQGAATRHDHFLDSFHFGAA